MAFTPPAATVFRDHATDGVPASGPHAPVPSDIRSLFANVETRINSAASDAGAAATAAASAASAATNALNEAVARGHVSGEYVVKGSALTPPGYLPANGYFGGTSCGLSGSRASADNWDLFNLWWNTLPGVQLKDSSGTDVAKGGSAAADFAAGKRFPIEDPGVTLGTSGNINWFVRI